MKIKRVSHIATSEVHQKKKLRNESDLLSSKTKKSHDSASWLSFCSLFAAKTVSTWLDWFFSLCATHCSPLQWFVRLLFSLRPFNSCLKSNLDLFSFSVSAFLWTRYSRVSTERSEWVPLKLGGNSPGGEGESKRTYFFVERCRNSFASLIFIAYKMFPLFLKGSLAIAGSSTLLRIRTFESHACFYVLITCIDMLCPPIDMYQAEIFR